MQKRRQNGTPHVTAMKLALAILLVLVLSINVCSGMNWILLFLVLHLVTDY